jgi:hypothetical protein
MWDNTENKRSESASCNSCEIMRHQVALLMETVRWTCFHPKAGRMTWLAGLKVTRVAKTYAPRRVF